MQRSRSIQRHGALVAALLLAAAGLPASGAAVVDVAPREIEAPRSALAATLAYMDRDAPGESELRMLGPEARERVVSVWGSVADLILSLEGVARRTSDFQELEGEARSHRLELYRAAFLASYRFAMDFLDRAERTPALEVIFDEAHPELGLPARSYARLKFHYLNVARATEYVALEVLHRKIGGSPPAGLAAGVREDSERILEMGRGRGPLLTAANAVDVVRDAAHSAWLPAQEGVSRWLGEVRVRRVGEALISPEQIRELRPVLEPGDILLERREWYLTNAGIPGFWPHAALYIGSPEERARFFADPEVAAWVASEGAASMEALLRSRYPESYAQSLTVDAGHRRRVLEAIADGVTFTSLEHSAAADSIAVLRPRLSRQERARGILRAFAYAGRPYDYDFDFVTDTALVCSELVYKAYQPGGGSRGLELPVRTVAGRLLMSPNEIARLYATERGGDSAQLDFVLMLDGSEKTGRAHHASELVFAESWQRPKWHIVFAEPASGAR